MSFKRMDGCEGCVNTIRSALKHKIGDVEIEANLEKHLLKIAFYKEAVTQSGVEKALAEIGFKPEH
ncbi:heavy-metal-associated domain-containing protein [Acidobacteria bacterium AH-259-G07]|nr:heavy-metal-associated domain-containing protein [Acidobacteria bacterium AH-259-G07]